MNGIHYLVILRSSVLAYFPSSLTCSSSLNITFCIGQSVVPDMRVSRILLRQQSTSLYQIVRTKHMTVMANLETPVSSHMKTIFLACTGIIVDHPLLLHTTLTSTLRKHLLLEDKSESTPFISEVVRILSKSRDR